jgi:excisionase family DNA binding protein
MSTVQRLDSHRVEEVVFRIPSAFIEQVAEQVRALLSAKQSNQLTESPYLSIIEAADYLRTSRQRIYDLLSSGRLTRFKDGSRVLLSRDEIDAYLAGTSLSPIAPRLPRTSKSLSTRGFTA